MNRFQTPSGHPVARIAFSPDGATLAVAQPHHGVTLLDRATGQVVRTVGTARAAAYAAVAFVNSGAWLAISTWKGLEVCDAVSGAKLWSSFNWLRSYQLKRTSVVSQGVVSQGRKLLTAGQDGVLEVLLPPAVQTPGWRTIWEKHHVLAVSPDQRWALGLRTRQRPVLIDLAACKVVAALDHPARTAPGCVPPTAEFAAGAGRVVIRDGLTVSVFDVVEEDPDEDPPTDPGSAPAKAPAPRPVLSPVFELGPPEPWPTHVPWFPPAVLTTDGRELLVRRPRNRLQLWDVGSGRRLNEWSFQLDSVTCLAVAPDGLTAVAGGRFGRLVAWDLE